jgi:hypothetical protein
LLASLPPWSGGDVQKFNELPASTLGILNDERVLDALRQRFGFPGGFPKIEVAYRRSALLPHTDRQDKPWSGLIYLAGDPKGTELYGLDGRFAKAVEWKPNRLVCWANKLPRAQHAVPKSEGRVVLVWWLLNNKASK